MTKNKRSQIIVAKSSLSYNGKTKKQNNSNSFIFSLLLVSMMRSYNNKQSNTNYKDNGQNKILL